MGPEMSAGVGAQMGREPELAPEHRRHLYAGEPDEDLIESLEPDQLVRAVNRPVPRRHLSRAGRVGLWGLRILLLATSAMVIYVFVLGAVRQG